MTCTPRSKSLPDFQTDSTCLSQHSALTTCQGAKAISAQQPKQQQPRCTHLAATATAPDQAVVVVVAGMVAGMVAVLVGVVGVVVVVAVVVVVVVLAEPS